MGNKINGLLEFGRFRLDVEKRFLWRDKSPVPLPLKSIELLCLLVGRGGQVVTKDEIWQTVWQDSFVEETNLTHNIYLLRKTFKDLGENDLIETVPRRGYRFTGEAREIENGELILEKRAFTKTEIEIEEEIVLPETENNLNGKANLPQNPLFSARSLAVFSAVAVLFLTGFFGYRNYQSKISAAEIKSIAVLPLRTFNENEQSSTLKIALTDNLISRLGNLKRFAVRPLSAVDKFEASGKDSLKFGEELKVDAVLEGTIQHSESRLRVNLRLLDVRDGTQIWAGAFDEKESDIFRLQDLIAGQVTRSLISNLNAAEKESLAKRPTENVEAYQNYVKGRELWSKRGNNLTESIFYFKKAIALDSKFALAYVGLADVQAMAAEPSLAEETLRKAIALDGSLAEPHATLGFIRMFHYFDWTAAESELKKAVELNPNYATAHHWLGVYYSIHRRLDEAKAEMLRAHELDPTSPIILTDIGQLFYFSHEYDRAAEFCRQSIALAPESAWNFGHLTAIYSKQGKEKEAFEAFLQWWERMSPDPLRSARELENARIRTTADFRQWTLNELKKYPNAPNACEDFFKNNLWLGNKEEALKWSDCAFEKGSRFTIAYFGVDPLYDDVRGEPRFQTILQKMNLR